MKIPRLVMPIIGLSVFINLTGCQCSDTTKPRDAQATRQMRLIAFVNAFQVYVYENKRLPAGAKQLKELYSADPSARPAVTGEEYSWSTPKRVPVTIDGKRRDLYEFRLTQKVPGEEPLFIDALVFTTRPRESN